MMRRFNPPPAEPFVAGGSAPAAEWEVRPSGMLVQKRETAAVPAAPTIRVKVKYGEGYHEIYVSAEATFGDVKKRVAERIGMHHLDLKVMFKDRERDSAAFIDVAGVKEGSKMLVVEDPTAKAKRILEERRQHKMDKAAKQVSAISVEVDRLIAKGKKIKAEEVNEKIHMRTHLYQRRMQYEIIMRTHLSRLRAHFTYYFPEQSRLLVGLVAASVGQLSRATVAKPGVTIAISDYKSYPRALEKTSSDHPLIMF